MRRLLLSISLTLGILMADARTIYVLSVGICHYEHIRDLKKTESDAITLAKLYKTHTTHVTLLLGAQATHDNILSELRKICGEATEGDAFVFFFSGHGGKGGLCAYDTRSEQSMVTYGEVQQVLQTCRANNKQLFIDACFSGGLRKSTSTVNSTTATAETSFNDYQGVMLFLSSRSNETSQENPWADNGFFTQYLLKGIKGAADTNGDRIITAQEIFSYVSSNVAKRTNGKQHPVMWGKFNNNMRVMNWNAKKP